MTSGSRRLLAVAALVALALVAALPVGAGALAHRPKAPEPLYKVSLSGSAQVEWTETVEGIDQLELPLGCLGEGSETERFSAAAQFAVKTGPIAIGTYGKHFHFLDFKVPFTSLSAAGSTDAVGHFAPDPTEPYPPSAAECTFAPRHTDDKCEFQEAAKLKSGNAYFYVSPLDLETKGDRVFIRQEESGTLVECRAGGGGWSLLREVPTKLRMARVLSLAKGHGVSDAATFTQPAHGPGDKGSGSETVTYRLVIKRVR